MALKFEISRLEDVAGSLREHYVRAGDKYQLATEGEHPKVSEFRDTNTRLMAELDPLKAKVKQFEGIDPAMVAATAARLAELEKAKPGERITQLETELASEKAARVDAQKRADSFVVESTVSDVFLKAGGLPKARTFIVAQASGLFVVENGKVKGTKFSPARPGEPMSVDEWVTLQTRENAFCFSPSGGGGADPKRGDGSATGVKELRDPSPQDLGRYAKEIAEGKVRLVYSS